MEQRNLGKSGLEVSLVGLGCNNFGGRADFEATRKVVHKALDLGINLFDTADIYGNRGGSEDFLGQLLGDRRKEIILASKFGMAMDDLGRQGKVRYIGCSNLNSWQTVEALWTSKHLNLNAFISYQNEYSLVVRD